MAEQLGEFKGQPWIVFDTVAARSFLVGETNPALFAFNTNGPAINARGEILFFTQGRTKANAPWYTNLELVGQLAYGFEAWQVYCHFGFPPWPGDASTADPDPTENFNQSPPALLAQLIINFGVLQLTLGQEQQLSFPVHKFGSAGGLWYAGAAGALVPQNAWPQMGNLIKLPEPIELPRTQNLDAKIRLAPEILSIIGTPAAPGVGCELTQAKSLEFHNAQGVADDTTVPMQPYTIQVGLVGRRVKKTQYGQTPQAQPST